jgi:hypothetical protein
MFTLSRKSVLKVSSVIGTLVMALVLAFVALAGGAQVTFAHDPELEEDGSAVGSPDPCKQIGYDDDYDGDINLCNYQNGTCKVWVEDHDTCSQCYALLDEYSCDPTFVCGDDGRVNKNCAAPVVTYCDGETVDVWKLTNGEGSLLFSFDLSTVPTSGNSDKLLKQVGQVKLYWRHEDGMLKLLAPQTDGKVYYMLLDPANCTAEREGAEWGLK